MSKIETLPELEFLSELYAQDSPESRLLAEYPSSNSDETRFQNKTKYIIHDPFPPPPRELLLTLGPHHLMCGWGKRVAVSSQVPPPVQLLDHWQRVFGDDGIPDWQPINGESTYFTLFPHQSLPDAQQSIDPEVNYRLHSKEVIELIDCLQAEVLPSVHPPCIVKLSHGYAGLGNFLIRDENDEVTMRRRLQVHWPDAVLVINSIIENVTGDFGVQFYLRRDGTMVWLGFTEQHFDNNKKWCGGTYSAKLQGELFDSFCTMIKPVGAYLHTQGYFGVVGIDILRDSSNKFYLVDVNPRLTGITPFLMASRIFAKDGNDEGVYAASCRFNGGIEALIDAAVKVNDARVLVLSAFEDDLDKSNPTTICHLSVSSDSQEKNQQVLRRII